ncbi:MAG: hypothetical protein KDB53_15330 [Planctomycetes bacterium]|nr:hypothetical protein [Planctomycetota bacterium]
MERQHGGQIVLQTVNGQPTLFYSDFNSFNTQITGQINVSGGDDDYIGFALGYQPNDVNNPNADYLLIDWKRVTQNVDFITPSCTPGTTAPLGLAVSRVSGMPTADEFWGHTDFDNATGSPLGQGLTELQRGTTLGSTGWVPNQSHVLEFVFNATALQVFVDAVMQINLSGNFANGRIAFDNFSQANVTYSAFSLTVQCPNAPVRQTYGNGFPGTLSTPTLTLDADPIVGTAPNLLCDNSSNTLTTGCLLVGTAQSSLFFPPLLAEFAVDPFAAATEVLDFAVPPAGLVVPIAIPLDQSLCGQSAYLQLIQYDLGAPFCFSFTPGLQIIIGD